VQAEERQSYASESRSDHSEQLREADSRDPDVRTDGTDDSTHTDPQTDPRAR